MAAIERATGRPAEAWFALLDAWGEPDHPRRAARLQEEGGASGWWAQSITVAYEQARGLRVEGQTSKGDFQASAQRTFAVPAEAAWAALMEAPWLGVPADWVEGAAFPVGDATITVRIVRPVRSLRFWRDVPERRTVVVSLEPRPDRPERTVVRFLESGLADAGELEAARARWRRALDRIGDACA